MNSRNCWVFLSTYAIKLLVVVVSTVVTLNQTLIAVNKVLLPLGHFLIMKKMSSNKSNHALPHVSTALASRASLCNNSKAIKMGGLIPTWQTQFVLYFGSSLSSSSFSFGTKVLCCFVILKASVKLIRWSLFVVLYIRSVSLMIASLTSLAWISVKLEKTCS